MSHADVPARTSAGTRPAAALLVAAAVAASALPACAPPQLLTLRSGLDSLRAVVDTMNVRDSLTFVVLQDARRELAEQRDILLSTRATTGSTTDELFGQMQRLQGRLDEVMGRFQLFSQRPTTPSTSPGQPDPGQMYDQAAQDLTQGRYSMALSGFREFVRRFPTSELADNAQYGIGECYFAQSQFDSAAAAYAQVESISADADKAPAALYKRALCEEKLGNSDAARSHFQDLVKRFPLSGEAQLAKERLGRSR